MQEKGFTKFEVILGLASLAVAALVAMPPLCGGGDQEKTIRAVAGAEEIARAVLDFRSDTGTWPGQMGEYADLSPLTHALPAAVEPGLVGTLGGMSRREQRSGQKADYCPWLQEVPLDPWHKPYRVAVVAFAADQRQGADRDWQFTPIRTGVYPIEPPAGVAVCVISAGPDGKWSTDLVQLRQTAAAGSTRLTAGAVTPAPSVQFAGDDLGFVLRGSDPGGES